MEWELLSVLFGRQRIRQTGDMGKQRNYGYGRRLDYAGRAALKQHYAGGHYGSVAAHGGRWDRFSAYARERGVSTMESLNPDLVRDYIARRAQDGIAVAERQNIVSTVNVVMRQATHGTWRTLSPREVVDARRDNVRHVAPVTAGAAGRNAHDEAVAVMRADGREARVRAAALLDLCRYSGARLREGLLMNLSRVDKEARMFGRIDVQDGVKGGRNAPRWVPVSPELRRALDGALSARPVGSDNLLAPNETRIQAVNGWVKTGRRAYQKLTGGRGYHESRAAMLCDVYRGRTGADAPVVAGSRQVAHEADRAAREEVAQVAGHGRTDVAAAYVGSSR